MADVPAHITLYAGAQPQPGGTAVVRVITRALAGEHNFMFSFDFTDTVTGPFSPTIYAPPNIHCDTIGPNPNYLVDKLTNMLLSIAMA